MPSRLLPRNRLRNKPSTRPSRRTFFEQLEDRRLLTHSPLAGGGFIQKPWAREAPALLAIGNGGSGEHTHAHDHAHGDQAPTTLFEEHEDPTDSGENDSQATAQFLSHFGTGRHDQAAIDVAGDLGAVPPAVASLEDNGSITLATTTGLVAGSTGRVTASATIGDGPHGSSGTHSGDYDHYRVPALANQLITVDVEVAGSTLNSVVAIYDSSGTLLTLNDDKFNNGVYGFSRDSHLRFLAPSNDTYSVIVFGSGAAPQANPFNSESGGGAASEGAYNLTILLETVSIIASSEDNGSIPLATATGLTLGHPGKVLVSGTVGDGPHGGAGTGSGDYDFFRVEASAGQQITVDLDTPIPLQGLDSTVSIFDSAGNELTFADDDAQTFDTFIAWVVPSTGTYFVVIVGYPGNFILDPFDSSTGLGFGSEGAYSATIEVASFGERDYYSFDLAAGDIFGANVFGGAGRLELYHPDGSLMIGSSQNLFNLYPEASPLPRDGNTQISYVINTPGRYAISVLSGSGAYTLHLRGFRPALEQQPVYSHQILYLDFDGANINAAETFALLLRGAGNPDAHLSPLSAILPSLGLSAASENAVIDAIVARVVDVYAHQVSGVVGRGLNGDFSITGRAGDFQIEILNSRDHADPFGLYPNVSRAIVGGTLAELGSPFRVLGMAPSLDLGNFVTAETAVALVEGITALVSIPLAPGKTMVDLLGRYMGDLIAHETGHFFGNWHTVSTTFNIMNAFFTHMRFVGPDGVFGTADDPASGFGRESYSTAEQFQGTEDTLNTIAFGLSTGTQAGTYFDFATGTLYVTGNIDDGRKDELEVKTAGSNLKVFINDELVLTRPAAGVNRIFLNGSSDKDELDASHYHGPVTLQGRGGKDELEGGTNNDLLFGDDGNDELDGGAGDDILVGGDGDDRLDDGSGRDVLIGGRGADHLLGDAAGDLLIGARTGFDANAAALAAVLAEWTSSRSYEARVANLRGTGTGTRANENFFLKVSGPKATVFDDDDADKLTGGSGRDWFFAHRTGNKKDKITDLNNNEWVDAL